MAGIVTNPMTQAQNQQNQMLANQAQTQQMQFMQNLQQQYLPWALNTGQQASGIFNNMQPVSVGQQQNIANQVYGNTAESGLSQSPNALNYHLQQAMATPAYAAQQQGAQNYYGGMSVPFGVANSMPGVQSVGTVQSPQIL